MAIIPFQTASLSGQEPYPDGSGADALDAEPAPGGRAGFQVPFHGSVAADALTEALGNHSFAASTLLSYPAGVSPEDFESWPADKRDSHWVRAAELEGANLLLECDLKASPRFRSFINEKFWLNLPLVLLGGPACYFINDRTYRGQARLIASLHLLDPIRDGRATLTGRSAQLFRAEVDFRETSLDLLERAGFQPIYYLASVFVPPGFLAVANQNVRDRLETAMAETLATELQVEIAAAVPSIVTADPIYDFHLDPEVRITSDGREIVVEGSAVLRQGQISRLESCSLSSGAHSLRLELEAGRVDESLSTRRDRYLRCPFEGRLPRDPESEFLTIELVAGGRERYRRTFSLRLPREDD